MPVGTFLLSHMRTGSTWLEGMLMEFYPAILEKPQPNLNKPNSKKIIGAINKGLLVKAHFWDQFIIYEYINKKINYKIVTIVRNPLDRLNSLNFFKKRNGKESNPKIMRLLEVNGYAETKQIRRMLPGYSTKNHTETLLPYIWTSYKWLLKNPLRELKVITEFLEINETESSLRNKINFSDKRTKSLSNFRKGVSGDWSSTFGKNQIYYLKYLQDEYNRRIEYEEICGRNNNIC